MKITKRLNIFISIVLCVAFLCSCGAPKQDTPKQEEPKKQEEPVTEPAIEKESEQENEPEDEPEEDPVTEPVEVITDTEGDAKEETESGPIVESPKAPDYGFTQAPEGYFDTALFIGDSRCVGLSRYGQLEGPDWFVDTGLSVFNFTKTQLDINGLGKVSIQQLFESEKVYDKVYIGLGINELGYALKTTESRFRDLLELINEYEPNATIYLMGNIHVSKKKSDSDKLYNNSKINTLNTMLRDLAEEDSVDNVYYIDCNPVFDDENSCLTQSYTFDNTHLLGKYYPMWADFIRSHVVM